MYSNAQVASFIKTHFVPLRVHVKDQADQFKQLGARFGALWTPNVIITSNEGVERHRIEGFLPVEDFLAQLTLGVGHAAFADGQFEKAEERFRDVVEQHGFTDAGPEAAYWAGVSRYKATSNPQALKETWKALETKYPDSSWAKKASVWA